MIYIFSYSASEFTRLDCKSLPGTKHSNSLLRKSANYGQKSFITFCPIVYNIQYFSLAIMKRPDKLKPGVIFEGN
jgi:hypothetical protein